MSTLAAALQALDQGQLHTITRIEVGELSPPTPEAIAQTAAGVSNDLFALLADTNLERDVEDVAYGLVNVFHRLVTRKRAIVDRLTDEIRILITEQDGSEVAANELEQHIDLARTTEAEIEAAEQVRDALAAHYGAEIGRRWSPSPTGRSPSSITAAVIDGREFLRARRERRILANTPVGTPVVFAGGRLSFGSNTDARTFAANLTRTLNRVRERVGDMYLVHGGDSQGLDRLAASWADQHGVTQLRFGLDRRLGTRAGFKRNEQMLDLKPRYLIAFEGSGVLERLVSEAKRRGITVVDRRGPLGMPPAA